MFDKFRGITRTYLDRMEIEEMAVFKVCLLALGALVGLATPKKCRTLMALGAAVAFVTTYYFLLRDLLCILFPRED